LVQPWLRRPRACVALFLLRNGLKWKETFHWNNSAMTNALPEEEGDVGDD
jgi:hypothetical protein